ncbi:MAG TPA: LLM class F420-dependent oxidoreductase [Methylomirabilota bacterium]|jgi:probable F420-dependent oxidoreductase|nr:LLM class F420-dependent oxidoreductase [Methylomirabilota bacterium]
MKIGVVFPQVEIGNDPAAIRDYAQAVEAMGYTHILTFDHVLGANPASYPGWKGPYTYRHPFHEPFVLFGFLAAATARVELVTGIIILPQRQTALVAKQAATVDVLSGGRLRLGVAVGWNFVEYEALGEDFQTRGQRIEEQIEMLRTLWTRELVTVKARWHRVSDAGINPLPVQRPIPIWMGGESERVRRRAARLADGWMPHFRPGPEAQALIDHLYGWVREAGRDPGKFGIEGRFTLAQVPRDQWAKELAAWRALRGVTHVCVHTVGLGLKTSADHVETLRRFRDEAGVR